VEPGAHVVKFKGGDGSSTESVTVGAGEKVVARLTRGAPPPSPTPTPSSPPPEAAPTPQPQSPSTGEAPAPRATKSLPENPSPPEEHPNQQMSVIPFVVGGVLIAASVGVAIGMKISLDSANKNAQSTGASIASAEQAAGIPPSTVQSAGCTSQTVTQYANTTYAMNNQGPSAQSLAGACGVWNSDNSNVNTDATIANVAIGVGIAAAVGTIVYGVIYATHSGSSSSSTSAASWIPTPMLDRSTGGLWLTGRF
jgi:hypothetical protein